MKQLTYFLAEKAQTLARADDEHTRVRAACAWGIAAFMRTCDVSGLTLDDAAVDKLEYTRRLFIVCYASMSEKAARANICLWKFRPKTHAFDHMIDDARVSRINLNRYSCWREADFLGKVKALTRTCHGGSVLLSSLRRYMLYLGLRWETRRRLKRWRVRT